MRSVESGFSFPPGNLLKPPTWFVRIFRRSQVVVVFRLRRWAVAGLEVGGGPTIRSSRRGFARRLRPGVGDCSMEYQLVIKLWRPSLADESVVASIEGALENAFRGSLELEGYDTSPKEFNFFMLTADPRPAFRRAKDVLEGLGIVDGISAAYRLNGGAQLTSIWPLRSMRKFKLPS
jgi:hypothetical protein